MQIRPDKNVVDMQMSEESDFGQIACLDLIDNRCSFELAARAVPHIVEKGYAAVVTAVGTDQVRRELLSLKERVPEFLRIHEKSEYLFLKTGWHKRVEKEGSGVLRGELEELLSDERFSFYHFYRADILLERVSRKDMELLIDTIFDTLRHSLKRALISYSTETSAGKRLEVYLADRCDTLLTQKSSIYEYEDSDGESGCNIWKSDKKSTPVLLISDNKKSVELHDLLFEKEYSVNYKRVSTSGIISDHREFLDRKTKLIIFNSERYRLCNRMVETLRSLAPNASIVWICEKEFVRKSERQAAAGIGIDMIFPKHFDLQDYILFLERVVGFSFYSHRSKRASYMEKIVTADKKSLKRHIEKLRRMRILFCEIEVESHETDERRLSLAIRNGDLVFIDKEEGRLRFILTDMLRSEAEKIISGRLGLQAAGKTGMDGDAGVLKKPGEKVWSGQ